MKIGLISLGCAKNLTDSERIVSKLLESGVEMEDDLTLCDVAIINTCGFIDEAKAESIENILQMGLLKEDNEYPLKKIVVVGCLAERYGNKLKEEIEEIDVVVPLSKNEIIDEIVGIKKLNRKSNSEEKPYVRFTPVHWGYLRISDGCNNHCSYCVIPMIRGKLKSESMDYILEKARELVETGVKELNIIAQDSANWGRDIYGKSHLPQLIRELNKIEELQWIRVLYLHPDHMSDDIIDAMCECDKVVKYFEIPMQHISERIIKSMNRKKSGDELFKLVKKIRKKAGENCVIRSSFIIGYPGETDEEFEELLDFLHKAKLDRVAIFRYSQEEDTKAALLNNQISDEIKLERMNSLIKLQNKIYKEKNRKLNGKIFDGLIETIDYDEDKVWVRTEREAPEVDGMVAVELSDDSSIELGEMIKIKITHTKKFINYGVIV